MSELTIGKEKEVVEVEGVSLFKQKHFLFLWIAGLFSSLSVSFFMFSQSWYVVEVLKLEASLGLIFIAASVPRLLFMALGGVIADRMSRSLIMFISDVTRALLIVGLVVLLVLDMISLWTFVGFALVFGVLDAFFWPASGAILPSLVSKEQLTRANSLVQVTNQFSMIVGPMIAGFIIHWLGYTVVFSATAILLTIAGVLVYMIKATPTKQTTEDTQEDGMMKALIEGIKYVKSNEFLKTLLVASIFLNLFVVGPLVMGLPLFVKNILDGSTLDFSFLEGALAFGMLTGAVIVGVLNIQKKRGLFALTMLGIMSLCYLALSQTTMLWQSVMALFLIGMMMSASNIPIMAIIQSIVEKEMIGRVMSIVSMSSMGLIPVSYALTSLFLAIGFPISTVMLIGAVPLILFLIYIFLRVPIIRTFD